MDPRPYHFEYRRPRMQNPTYQSMKLYESIYQLDSYRKVNPQRYNKNNQIAPKAPSQKMNRHQSFDIGKPQKIMLNRKKSSPKQNLNSSLSQYGNNLLNTQYYDQNRVYQKQQKEFNIINYHPKNYSPNLKNYPRLTLQDKIIERKPQQTTNKQ